MLDVIAEQLDAFAGGELTLLVLSIDARLSTAKTGLCAPPLEFLNYVFHEVPGPPSHWAARIAEPVRSIARGELRANQPMDEGFMRSAHLVDDRGTGLQIRCAL